MHLLSSFFFFVYAVFVVRIDQKPIYLALRTVVWLMRYLAAKHCCSTFLGIAIRFCGTKTFEWQNTHVYLVKHACRYCNEGMRLRTSILRYDMPASHKSHCCFDSYLFGRDGRIKVIGGDGIEGLFISPKQLPYKYIEVSVCTIHSPCLVTRIKYQ